MKVALVTNSIDLQKEFEQSSFFNEVTIPSDDNVCDTDILIICDDKVPYTSLISYFDKMQRRPNHVFYVISQINDNTLFDNINVICKSQSITIIPPGLTSKQVLLKVLYTIFPNLDKERNKVITFFGADSKVGTTMIAQSVAEMLSKRTNLKVGLLFLGGHPSKTFFKSAAAGLDNIKVKLLNKILSSHELLGACVNQDNLYILPGNDYILDTRHYHPDHIEYLLELASGLFDVILIDAGYNIDSGMAIASLNSSSFKYLVTTQQTSARENFERIASQIFTILDIRVNEFLLLVNKYVKSNSIYTASQISELYKIPLAAYIPHLELLGWQAEYDKKTLLAYNHHEYNSQIELICKQLAAKFNIKLIEETEQKKSLLHKLFKFGG